MGLSQKRNERSCAMQMNARSAWRPVIFVVHMISAVATAESGHGYEAQELSADSAFPEGIHHVPGSSTKEEVSAASVALAMSGGVVMPIKAQKATTSPSPPNSVKGMQTLRAEWNSMSWRRRRTV